MDEAMSDTGGSTEMPKSLQKISVAFTVMFFTLLFVTAIASGLDKGGWYLILALIAFVLEAVMVIQTRRFMKSL